jgi:hypothetical protein
MHNPTNPDHRPLAPWRHGPGLLLLAAMVLALGAGGCSSSRPNGPVPGSMEASLPRLASVMNGPVAMLLTNADGFRAPLAGKSAWTPFLQNHPASPRVMPGLG